MLYIYTDKIYLPSNKMLVLNVEVNFNAYFRDSTDCFDIDEAVHALETIDGMKSHMGSVLVTRFGACTLLNISTGCKGVVLAICRPELIISNLEIGDNAMLELFDAAKTRDISIYLEKSIPVVHNLEQHVYYNNSIMTLNRVFDIAYEKFEV